MPKIKRAKRVKCIKKKTKSIKKKSTVRKPKKRDDADREITVLVDKVRHDGDESSFEQLQSYLNYYIKMFGNKYRIPGCDSDEIEQECLFALRYKAIEDFNPDRGKFKSFAILCIKRHLFSLIKGSKQLKRTALNTSISLDQDRIKDGESLSLSSLVECNGLSADRIISRNEDYDVEESKLLSKLSHLEQEVIKLYLQQLHYDEIVVEMKKKFPGKKCSKKQIDNALQRARAKAQSMLRANDFFEK